MSNKKVAIVGSRKYGELGRVREYVRRLPDGASVISGGAPGVDSAAEDEARLMGIHVTQVRPDYDSHPPHIAPIVRNSRIVELCDELVAFWDGESGGTWDAISKAKRAGKLSDVFGVPIHIQKNLL